MKEDELLVKLADILDCGETTEEILDTAAAVSNQLYEAGQREQRWAPVLRVARDLWEMWREGEYRPSGPEQELVVSYDLAQKREGAEDKEVR